MDVKRAIPPEIDMLYSFCLKEGYHQDAAFMLQFKQAMQRNMQLGENAKKHFAQIVLLYKTAKILGRT